MVFAFCREKKARINEIRPSEQFWISSNKVGTIHYLCPTLFRQATINDKVTVKLTSQISIKTYWFYTKNWSTMSILSRVSLILIWHIGTKSEICRRIGKRKLIYIMLNLFDSSILKAILIIRWPFLFMDILEFYSLKFHAFM